MKHEIILNKIIKLKISTNSACFFSGSEIDDYCLMFSITRFELVNNILCLSPISPKTQRYYSKRFLVQKEKYFEEYSNELMITIIKYTVEHNSNCSFTLEQINCLSKLVNINSLDLTKYVLKSKRLQALIRGEYKSFDCAYYKEKKAEYLETISSSTLHEIMLEKLKKSHSKNFDFDEIEAYSQNYNINIKDFLVCILKINKYRDKPYSKKSIFASRHYKEVKEKYLKSIKFNVLKNIVAERVSYTSSYAFDTETIDKLSNSFNINKRDFVVFILGKSDQLFHDIKSQRQDTLYSDDYRKVKEQFINERRGEIAHLFDENIKTYYTADEINSLAVITGINSNDIITNIFGKTRKNLYNLRTNYRNRKRISYGNYKSTRLPKTYIENNYDKLNHIVEVAAKSAIGFFTSRKQTTRNLYDDLLQEGLIYLFESGNPWNVDQYMITDDTVEYDETHGQIFYKKAFYNNLTIIKKSLPIKNNSSKSYEIALKTRGKNDEYNTAYNANDLISEVATDSLTKAILVYFSENNFSFDSVNELSDILEVSNKTILLHLKKARSYIESNPHILEKVRRGN